MEGIKWAIALLVIAGVYVLMPIFTATASGVEDKVKHSMALATEIQFNEWEHEIWFPILLDGMFIRVYKADLGFQGGFVRDHGAHAIFVVSSTITDKNELLGLVVHEGNHLASMYLRKTGQQMCQITLEQGERESYVEQDIFMQFISNYEFYEINS